MSGTTPNPMTSHSNAGIAAWRFKMTHEVRSYEQAREVFRELATTPATMTTDRVDYFPDRWSSRCGYKIGPKMYVTEGDGYCSVWLYRYEIIRYWSDATFSVDCGEWTTPTTRERLSAVVPGGFRPYFHDHRLGLVGHGSGWAKRRKVQNSSVLWPLDHGVRIDAATGARH